MKIVKHSWLLAAFAAPMLCSPNVNAATGDWSDQISHYGFSGDTGDSGDKFAVLVGKITDLTTLDSDLTATLGFSCTHLNGCYVARARNGAATGLPTGTNDPQAMDDAVSALAAIKLAAPDAQLALLIGTAKDGTNLGIQVATGLSAVSADVAVFTYGIPSNDTNQSTISTFFTGSAIVPVAAVGMITYTGVIPVGGTTYTGGGADTVWGSSPGNGLVMSRMSQIPRTKGGSAVTLDSVPWGVAAVAGRLDNETDGFGPATKADLQAAISGHFSTHFTAVSGGSPVFKDGTPLR